MEFSVLGGSFLAEVDGFEFSGLIFDLNSYLLRY